MLSVAAVEPFPILRASAQWCTVFGVQEADVKGCGFKAFDTDFRPLVQGKLAEFGGREDLSPQVTAAMVTAIQQRRAVHLAAVLELDDVRAAECQCPPSRSVVLMIEPMFEEPAAEASPSELRVTLKEQCISSMKEAMGDLASGKATVLSQVSAPYRISNVSSRWKEFFGLEEAESVGRSIKIIEGPLTQQTTLLALYDAVAAGAALECELTTYHMDGRAHVNHLRVVPVFGGEALMTEANSGSARKPNAQALAAAASGITHCLWYMDAHEVVMERDAMSDAFYGSKSKILTSANPPHVILDINQKWVDACLLERPKVVGKTLAVVQGPATEKSATREASRRLAQRKAGYVEVINYRGDGAPFINRLKLHPVLSERTGEITGGLGLVEQSMSPGLTRVVSEGAKAAVVVSASYPHTILHLNNAWLDEMMPDYMHTGEKSTAAFVGKALGSIALVSKEEVGNDKETDDLMRISKGRNMRILVAHRDPLSGCGAWCKAAVAPVIDVVDATRVTHLVLSLDLSLAEQKAPAAATAFAGLLRRTCEESAVYDASMTRSREDWRAVEDPVAEKDPRCLRNGLLQRTCESKGEYVEDDEEQYMDSEEEQELIGNQLPQEEVARALKAYLDKHQARRGEYDDDDDHAVEAGNPKLGFSEEPSEKYAALKKRTLLLSDDELFQAIADSKNVHSHTRDFGLYHQVDELDASSTDADADDEDTDDLRQESEDENRADGLGEICHGDDRRKKPRGTRGRSPTDEAEYSAVDGGSDLDLRHRDACGNMWSNSEVFTSVRVHVADGEAIAPIYDEYLRHLRAKGFVESWSWPMLSTLCIQVPFGRLEKATNKSSWCAQHAADLSSGHAWWNRLRYLVAVVQYNMRSKIQQANDSDEDKNNIFGDSETCKDRLETIMMPRGSVSCEDREIGLACLRDINVIETWAWDNEEAVEVVVRVEALRAACAQSTFCNTWAPPTTDPKLETWGVAWLRMVWLTAQQKAFRQAVHDEDVELDIETCLCSLHLHGLLPYD